MCGITIKSQLFTAKYNQYKLSSHFKNIVLTIFNVEYSVLILFFKFLQSFYIQEFFGFITFFDLETKILFNFESVSHSLSVLYLLLSPNRVLDPFRTLLGNICSPEP